MIFERIPTFFFCAPDSIYFRMDVSQGMVRDAAVKGEVASA